MATDITEHVPEAAEQSGVTKVIVTQADAEEVADQGSPVEILQQKILVDHLVFVELGRFFTLLWKLKLFL